MKGNTSYGKQNICISENKMIEGNCIQTTRTRSCREECKAYSIPGWSFTGIGNDTDER